MQKSIILELVDKDDSGIYYENLKLDEMVDTDIVKQAAKQNPFALWYYQEIYDALTNPEHDGSYREYNMSNPEFLQNILDFPPFEDFKYDGNVLADADYMLEIIN